MFQFPESVIYIYIYIYIYFCSLQSESIMLIVVLPVVLYEFKSRGSSVGIAIGYRLVNRVSVVRFPAEAGNFSLHHRVQTVSGAHPASCPMGTGGSFSVGKAAGE
jgi:hypothetical protein